MVPGCVPFKIVSDSPTLHSRWLLFLKVMIISLWNLLQYHSIVRWAIQAQWAEPLVSISDFAIATNFLIIFLSLLSPLSVHRPSVNFSHFNQLLWSHWANLNQILVEWSLDDPLPNLCRWSRLPTKMATKLKIEKRGDEILIQNELKF